MKRKAKRTYRGVAAGMTATDQEKLLAQETKARLAPHAALIKRLLLRIDTMGQLAETGEERCRREWLAGGREHVQGDVPKWGRGANGTGTQGVSAGMAHWAR
jgi:hypothetical protein